MQTRLLRLHIAPAAYTAALEEDSQPVSSHNPALLRTGEITVAPHSFHPVWRSQGVTTWCHSCCMYESHLAVSVEVFVDEYKKNKKTKQNTTTSSSLYLWPGIVADSWCWTVVSAVFDEVNVNRWKCVRSWFWLVQREETPPWVAAAVLPVRGM